MNPTKERGISENKSQITIIIIIITTKENNSKKSKNQNTHPNPMPPPTTPTASLPQQRHQLCHLPAAFLITDYPQHLAWRIRRGKTSSRIKEKKKPARGLLMEHQLSYVDRYSKIRCAMWIRNRMPSVSRGLQKKGQL